MRTFFCALVGPLAISKTLFSKGSCLLSDSLGLLDKLLSRSLARALGLEVPQRNVESGDNDWIAALGRYLSPVLLEGLPDLVCQS